MDFNFKRIIKNRIIIYGSENQAYKLITMVNIYLNIWFNNKGIINILKKN